MRIHPEGMFDNTPTFQGVLLKPHDGRARCPQRAATPGLGRNACTSRMSNGALGTARPTFDYASDLGNTPFNVGVRGSHYSLNPEGTAEVAATRDLSKPVGV